MAFFDFYKKRARQKKYLEVLLRDHWTCTLCRSTENELPMHCVDYFEDVKPWDHPKDMLMTLCNECYSKEMQRPRYEGYLLQSLKMNGFLAFDVLHLSTLIDRDKNFVNYVKKRLREDNQ